MHSSLDRFIRKRQAPAEGNCGEEEECQEKEPKTTEDMERNKRADHFDRSGNKHLRGFSLTRLRNN